MELVIELSVSLYDPLTGDKFQKFSLPLRDNIRRRGGQEEHLEVIHTAPRCGAQSWTMTRRMELGKFIQQSGQTCHASRSIWITTGQQDAFCAPPAYMVWSPFPKTGSTTQSEAQRQLVAAFLNKNGENKNKENKNVRRSPSAAPSLQLINAVNKQGVWIIVVTPTTSPPTPCDKSWRLKKTKK